jgi:hypothetical protein
MVQRIHLRSQLIHERGKPAGRAEGLHCAERFREVQLFIARERRRFDDFTVLNQVHRQRIIVQYFIRGPRKPEIIGRFRRERDVTNPKSNHVHFVELGNAVSAEHIDQARREPAIGHHPDLLMLRLLVQRQHLVDGSVIPAEIAKMNAEIQAKPRQLRVQGRRHTADRHIR